MGGQTPTVGDDSSADRSKCGGAKASSSAGTVLPLIAGMPKSRPQPPQYRVLVTRCRPHVGQKLIGMPYLSRSIRRQISATGAETTRSSLIKELQKLQARTAVPAQPSASPAQPIALESPR
jgi:hypothetical protein